MLSVNSGTSENAQSLELRFLLFPPVGFLSKAGDSDGGGSTDSAGAISGTITNL